MAREVDAVGFVQEQLDFATGEINPEDMNANNVKQLMLSQFDFTPSKYKLGKGWLFPDGDFINTYPYTHYDTFPLVGENLLGYMQSRNILRISGDGTIITIDMGVPNKVKSRMIDDLLFDNYYKLNGRRIMVTFVNNLGKDDFEEFRMPDFKNSDFTISNILRKYDQ